MLAGGCLSIPRDFSSPPTSIRVFDQSGAPMSGIEVRRHWYDSDSLTDGSEVVATDQTGTAQFSKVSANVGLFTGAWRKTYSHLGMCGEGSGTSTGIDVRFHGLYDVGRNGKPSHRVGHPDADGVWFTVSVDSLSNTVVSLEFPKRSKTIYDELSAKLHGK
jgi:hypothetical protein